MKARGAEKKNPQNYRAKHRGGGGFHPPPPALLGLTQFAVPFLEGIFTPVQPIIIILLIGGKNQDGRAFITTFTVLLLLKMWE